MTRCSLLVLLCSLLGCREAQTRPAAERTCFPVSAWRTVEGAPAAEQALGMLQHPLSSPALHAHAFEVRWTAGGMSRATAAELLASPEGSLVPILQPLSLPAVFEVDAKQALVWGARGWGCVDRHWSGKDGYLSHDALLARAVATIDAFRKVSTSADGYTLHEGLMVTLSGRLHVAASDTAAASSRARVEPSQCSVVSDPLADGRPEPPTLAVLAAAKSTLQTCPTPVRITRQVGDWAEVVLPREGSPLYRTARFFVVRWADAPAGWARLTAPGQPAGTKKLLWHIERWHMP